MLKREDCLTVLIDVQGRLAELVVNSGEMFKCAGRLLRGSKVLGIPMIYTEQLPDKIGATRPELMELLDGASRFVKSSFDCCGADGFLAEISKSGRRQIMLCGIEAHICVCQTGLELLESGYEVFVVADAVSARDLDQKNAALNRLRQAGAVVVTVEMALFELLKDARDGHFRDILGIVK